MPTLGRATEGSSWAQPSTVSLGAATLQARGDDFDQEVCRCILCKLDGISNRSQGGRGGRTLNLNLEEGINGKGGSFFLTK